ncbi:MAG: helix-turn-helix transcriptional regulator [Luteibaculaceae bacterium]
MKNSLKVARAIKNLTQQELADLCGVSRQAIINIEKNKFNPSVELALKMALALDKKVEELFELE